MPLACVSMRSIARWVLPVLVGPRRAVTGRCIVRLASIVRRRAFRNRPRGRAVSHRIWAMPSLTIRTGNRSGEVLTFERTIVIGRGAADVVLVDSTVSRRHAELAWRDGRCTVTDLRTGNGTFVNGKRISVPTPLADGDELWLGRVVMAYSSAGARKAAGGAGLGGPGRGEGSRPRRS